MQNPRVPLKPLFSLHPLGRAISMVAILAAAAPVISVAQTTTNQVSAASQQTQEFNIPAGSLSLVLSQFAGAAGVALSFDAARFAGLQSSGLQGRYTLEQGFAAILGGSGYQAVAQGNGDFVLAPVPKTDMTKLKTVTVSASGLEGSIAGNSYTTPLVTIGKHAGTLREIPQSVSVVTRQRIEDQNLTTLDQALEQTTGMTITKNSSITSTWYSRGYEITNIQLDGAAAMYRGFGLAMLPDLSQLEQVELLRGAEGLFSGSGEPGGTLNLVRKRPTIEFQGSALVSASEWDRYRTEVDVAGGLFADGAVRGRAVLSYEDGDTFEKVAHTEKTMVYGILEFDLSPSTLLTLGGNYDDRSQPYAAFGLPRFSDGRDLRLPRDTYIAPSWATYDSRIETVFAQLKQQFNNAWDLTVDMLDTGVETDRTGLNFAATVDPVTFAAGSSTATRYQYSSDQASVDATLRGHFELFGRQHELVFGGSWQDVESTAYGQQTAARYAIDNIFTFTPYDFPKPAADAFLPFFQQPAYGIKQTGFYGVGRFALTDALKLIVGARNSSYEQNYFYQPLNIDGSVTSTTNSYHEDKNVVTPYGGLVYTLSENWNLYTSVGETWKSQANNLKGPLPGTPLDAITGRNYEAGVKGDFGQGKVNTYLSFYRIERNGQGIRDTNYVSTPGEFGSNCCWLDDGKAISQGVDTEISGELTDNWRMSMGYTWNDNETRRGASTGRFSTATPEHLLKVYTSWRLPAALSDWRVGGGVTAQSENYAKGNVRLYDANGQPGTNVPYEFIQSGYSVWNAFVEYRVHPQWTATLNINNVFDKTYYSTIGNSAYYNFYGEPRNLGLTLRGKF